MTLGFGAPEISFEMGRMRFNRWIDESGSDGSTMHLQREPYETDYVQPGIEYSFADIVGLYVGARMLRDLDTTEYMVQLRILKGK